jgi:hypothetical protein
MILQNDPKDQNIAQPSCRTPLKQSIALPHNINSSVEMSSMQKELSFTA